MSANSEAQLHAPLLSENPDSTAAIRRCVSIPIRDELNADFVTFHGASFTSEHIALGLGAWRSVDVPLVRLHSECLTGDIFGSHKCDCGPQLDEAISRIAAAGGVLVYLRQEGRGIGLYNKIDAYHLQSQGLDTFEANQVLNFPDDLRDFRCAAEMLLAMGLRKIRLLTNNPDKVAQLQAHGIEVVEAIPTGVHETDSNKRYLEAKRLKAGHNLKVLET